GIITTIAGNGSSGYSGDGGLATAATLNSPDDVAVDGVGIIYIADYSNSAVRRQDPASGILTTFAGNGTSGDSGDGGPAVQGQISGARNVAVNAAGDVFVTDQYYVRKISAATGIISTVVGGNGSGPQTGALATASNFFELGTVASDAVGNLYVSDEDEVFRVDGITGLLTLVAGRSLFSSGYSGDGGPAILATLATTDIVGVDAAGNLYLSDGSRLRYVDLSTPLAVVSPQTIAVGAASGSGQV